MCVGSLESNEFNQDGLSFSIGTRSDGLTALMLAAVAGHSAAVRALLAGGVALDTEEEAPRRNAPQHCWNPPGNAQTVKIGNFSEITEQLIRKFLGSRESEWECEGASGAAACGRGLQERGESPTPGTRCKSSFEGLTGERKQ